MSEPVKNIKPAISDLITNNLGNKQEKNAMVKTPDMFPQNNPPYDDHLFASVVRP